MCSNVRTCSKHHEKALYNAFFHGFSVAFISVKLSINGTWSRYPVGYTPPRPQDGLNYEK